MAGGKDQKDANAMIRQQQTNEIGQAKQFDTRNEADMNAAQGRGNELYDQLHSGYTSLADKSKAIGGGGGGGGGGFTPPSADPRFKESEGSYRDFMKTGGWDAKRTASIDENVGKMKALGYDPTTVDRMRGGGVYDEFAKTGGLSDQDRSNMRQRGNAVIPAFYNRMKDAGDQQSAVQGGYGPGRMAMMSRMARDQSAGAQSAALNTELGITDQVNKGRQWGAAGMTDSEGKLGSLRMDSLRGATDAETGMVNSQNQGKQWGTTGLEGMAQSDRQAAMQAAAQAASNSHFDQSFALQQQMAGLGGLQSLYSGDGSGEYNTDKNFDLQNRGQSQSGVVGGASALKTGNKSWTDYAAPIVGAVAGGLTGGLAPAIGGVLKKKVQS